MFTNTPRALTSDWSVNSFVMVVYGYILVILRTENSAQTFKKEFHETTITKLFVDQSELSALPAGCNIYCF